MWACIDISPLSFEHWLRLIACAWCACLRVCVFTCVCLRVRMHVYVTAGRVKTDVSFV